MAIQLITVWEQLSIRGIEDRMKIEPIGFVTHGGDRYYGFSSRGGAGQIKVYSEAQLKQAILEEREACAAMLINLSEKIAPTGERTNQIDCHVAEVLERQAFAIRARSDEAYNEGC
jgi:hypothetical protein